MSTTIPAVNSIQRQWWVVDAKGQVLGRMASRIALVLRGKHKVSFTPHLDTGDFVVVINAKAIKTTPRKLDEIAYTRYSGYPSGLKQWTLGQMLERKPAAVVELAVKGMIPDGPLGRHLLTKLKVYPGPDHPHGAQDPKPLSLNN
jgi:large subunit ribosomal protein L13